MGDWDVIFVLLLPWCLLLFPPYMAVPSIRTGLQIAQAHQEVCQPVPIKRSLIPGVTDHSLSDICSVVILSLIYLQYD